MKTAVVTIPTEVERIATDSFGAFFESVSPIDRTTRAADHLDLNKSLKRASILQRYVTLKSSKLLEVGSGFGTNLAVWIKNFEVDGYGIEADSEGFESSLWCSRELLRANRISPERIIAGAGESLPYPDESFDIVYSANVLEHTQRPTQVLSESVRVLKRGGILHMEMPNFLSYFEGHYMVIQPPILWRWMLPAWVRFVLRRDPAFAKTLRTEINPLWCRSVLRDIGRRFPLKLISLGEDLFLDRLCQPFDFETQAVRQQLKPLIRAMQALNVANWIGRSIVLLQGHYPIYLTLQRL